MVAYRAEAGEEASPPPRITARANGHCFSIQIFLVVVLHEPHFLAQGRLWVRNGAFAPGVPVDNRALCPCLGLLRFVLLIEYTSVC